MRGMLAIAIVSAVIAAAPARADDRTNKARQKVGAADIDYRLGRFAQALDEYTTAYEIYPVPPLLFNIGQCHKQLESYKEAIFFFEGYLRDDPTTSQRAVVEDLIRESRAALERAQKPERADPEPPAVPQAEPPAEPPAEPQAAPPAGPRAEPPAGSPASAPTGLQPGEPTTPAPEAARGRSRVVPAVMIGGGVAALATGGALYYYGQKRGPGEKYVYDDTRLAGGTLIVVGAAALVVGGVLWPRHPAAGAPVAALAPGAGYVGWAGAF